MRTIENIGDKPKEITLLEKIRNDFQARLFDLLEQKKMSISKLLIEIDQVEKDGKVKGLSDSQFRNALSPSYNSLPNIDVVILIAHVLGVSLNYLLGINGDDIYYEKVGELDGVDLLVRREKLTTELITKYAQPKMDMLMLCVTLDFENYSNPYPPVNIAPSEYILVDGVLYQGKYSPNNALGFNFSINEYINNIAKETSYIQKLTFGTENDVYKLSEAAQYLKDSVRQLRKTHRAIRGYLGALGTLSADNYILLCYLLGHSQQEK